MTEQTYMKGIRHEQTTRFSGAQIRAPVGAGQRRVRQRVLLVALSMSVRQAVRGARQRDADRKYDFLRVRSHRVYKSTASDARGKQNAHVLDMESHAHTLH